MNKLYSKIEIARKEYEAKMWQKDRIYEDGVLIDKRGIILRKAIVWKENLSKYINDTLSLYNNTFVIQEYT